MQPRIGGGDDGADGLLVEALVALATLEVLEMAADGASLRGISRAARRRSSPAPGASRRGGCATGQRSPAVNAWRRNGKSENGGMVSMPASAFSPSRRASKSNWASRWCMPASRIDSPCRATQSPTVPGRGRSGSAWWAKSSIGLLGGEVEVGEDDDAGRRMLEDWAPQPAWAPAWKRSRSSKPSAVNMPMTRGKNRREQRKV